MTKNDNQNTGAKLVTIPLRVNPETIEENGQLVQISSAIRFDWSVASAFIG